jgi:hypothetical protein
VGIPELFEKCAWFRHRMVSPFKGLERSFSAS